MRIVIDARESGTSTGRYVDKLVEYLSKLKPEHEIIILTKSPRLEFFKKIAPGFQVVRSDIKEFTFAEQLALTRQIKSLKPNLVHFTMTQQPVMYKGPTITTIHDLTTVRFDNPSKNKLVYKSKQQVYKRVIERVARKSAYVITPSEYVKSDVAQFARIDHGKIVVTHEAADIITEAAQPLKQLAGKQFVMYVGRPQPHKNLWRLIESFVILKQKYPALKLVLAGKKDVLFERIEHRVKKEAISGVVFTDFVSEGQLRWLYQNTAAYVFPSLSEGFGLPGLEAMAHGAPVVSSNATCLPEIYGQAAVYFNPLDVNDIVTGVTQVLSDPKLQAKLVADGQRQAAKYSWQRMAKQTLEIYNKALIKNT